MPRNRNVKGDEKDIDKEWEPTNEKTRAPHRSKNARRGGDRDDEHEPVKGRGGMPPLARGEQGHADAEDLEPEEPKLDEELGAGYHRQRKD